MNCEKRLRCLLLFYSLEIRCLHNISPPGYWMQAGRMMAPRTRLVQPWCGISQKRRTYCGAAAQFNEALQRTAICAWCFALKFWTSFVTSGRSVQGGAIEVSGEVLEGGLARPTARTSATQFMNRIGWGIWTNRVQLAGEWRQRNAEIIPLPTFLCPSRMRTYFLVGGR